MDRPLILNFLKGFTNILHHCMGTASQNPVRRTSITGTMWPKNGCRNIEVKQRQLRVCIPNLVSQQRFYDPIDLRRYNLAEKFPSEAFWPQWVTRTTLGV